MLAAKGRKEAWHQGLEKDRPCRCFRRFWRQDPDPAPGGIQKIRDIRRSYILGATLQPSSQPGTEVCYAERVSDNKEFAIKIRRKGPGNERAFMDIKDEMSWRKSVELVLTVPPSQYLVGIPNVLEDSERYYVTMDLVEGKDLGRVLRHRPLKDEEIRTVMRQILLGLQALHDSGVLHRDIKLENIMLDSNLLVKLVDFDDVEPWPLEVEEGETRWVRGSDQYIAPEEYSGESSPQSDLFSAGVVLYKMLFQRFPFKAFIFDDRPGENWVGSPAMQAIRERLERVSINWSSDVEGVRPEAIHFCQKLMAIDPKSRFSSATQALVHPWINEGMEAKDGLSQDASRLPHDPTVEEQEVLNACKLLNAHSALEEAEKPLWKVSEESVTRNSTLSTQSLTDPNELRELEPVELVEPRLSPQ